MSSATYPSRHLSCTIDRAADAVYRYASDPRHLPDWAAGLSTTISLVDGEWVAESDLGRITVELVDDNPFGVLDHTVVLPDGTRVHNPLRVVPNGEGCDVVFSLFRLPGVDDAAFESDATAVAADLERLKSVVEALPEAVDG